MSNNVKNKFEEAKDNVADVTNSVSDKAEDVTNSVSDKVEDTTKVLSDKAIMIKKNMLEFVKEHPCKALAIAVLSGWVVAKLL